MNKSRLLRSMLYIPANSWRMITNGLASSEDAVIFDLEDAVPVAEKETARIFARDAISLFKKQEIDVFIRINSLGSGLSETDISYVAVEGLDGIMLAKTETKDDVVKLDAMLRKEEISKGLEENSIAILPLVESPLGVKNVYDIASASKRIIGISFGAGDFMREMGMGFAVTRLSFEEYFMPILYARSRIAQASRIAGIEAIDTPFFGFLTDIKGLNSETGRVKLLGFSGKQIIHPRHIDAVNTVFSPSEADINYAKSVAQALGEAESRGAGSISFGGRMIDYAVVKMSRDLIEKAEKLAAKASTRREKTF